MFADAQVEDFLFQKKNVPLAHKWQLAYDSTVLLSKNDIKKTD